MQDIPAPIIIPCIAPCRKTPPVAHATTPPMTVVHFCLTTYSYGAPLLRMVSETAVVTGCRTTEDGKQGDTDGLNADDVHGDYVFVIAARGLRKIFTQQLNI